MELIYFLITFSTLAIVITFAIGVVFFLIKWGIAPASTGASFVSGLGKVFRGPSLIVLLILSFVTAGCILKSAGGTNYLFKSSKWGDDRADTLVSLEYLIEKAELEGELSGVQNPQPEQSGESGAGNQYRTKPAPPENHKDDNLTPAPVAETDPFKDPRNQELLKNFDTEPEDELDFFKKNPRIDPNKPSPVVIGCN